MKQNKETEGKDKILKIRFEKDYPKLQGLTKAKLIEIFEVDFEELSMNFIDYDARQSDGEYYQFPLKLKRVMVLLFANPDNHRMFTTIRRHTDRKFYYYANNIGNWFEIVRG